MCVCVLISIIKTNLFSFFKRFLTPLLLFFFFLILFPNGCVDLVIRRNETKVKKRAKKQSYLCRRTKMTERGKKKKKSTTLNQLTTFPSRFW